jgi:hypothetical protein
MDDKTYNRIFGETYWQARRRMNGMSQEQICYRRCKRCHGAATVWTNVDTGRIKCPTCKGTGELPYKRTR